MLGKTDELRYSNTDKRNNNASQRNGNLETLSRKDALKHATNPREKTHPEELLNVTCCNVTLSYHTATWVLSCKFPKYPQIILS